jgi:small-conductance mechanosensitive channel
VSFESVMEWLVLVEVAGISLANLSLASAVAIGSFIVMVTVVRFARRRLEVLRYKTVSQIDDLMAEVLAGTNKALLALAALLIGVGMLDLPLRWTTRVDDLWFFAIGLQLALWINRAITIAARRHFAPSVDNKTLKMSATTTLMVWGLRVMLWSVVVLAILSNLGVNITAFVASLGVGGIAVALAVQNILGDLFASLSIAVDKPFEVGDFIIMGDVLGSVEQVGLKTTRLRSLGGEQIVMSNAELLKTTIRNYKRMMERRIVFSVGLTYDTTSEQAGAVPGIIRRVVESQDKTRFDRAHFKTFGNSSLDFEVVYYVLDPDFGNYMDIQQAINLELMREFEALGVSFAFPTQTVYLVPPPKRTSNPEDAAPLRRMATRQLG